MTATPFTRHSRRIVFGAGRAQFSVVDLEAPEVTEAARQLRYGPNSNLDLAQALDDYRYLVMDCPSTRRAQQKLALLRRAYREVAK